jgi:hypothetical protein
MSIQVFDGDGEDPNKPYKGWARGELRVIEILGSSAGKTAARVRMEDHRILLEFNLHATGTSRPTIDLLEKYQKAALTRNDKFGTSTYKFGLQMDNYVGYGCWVLSDVTASTPDGELFRTFTLSVDRVDAP